MEIEEFAVRLRTFLELFDSFFLHDTEAEALLMQTKESLEDRILHNESALVIIAAMGGKYNGKIDRAKVRELAALLDLLRARKDLRTASLEENKRARNDEALRGELFGV